MHDRQGHLAKVMPSGSGHIKGLLENADGGGVFTVSALISPKQILKQGTSKYGIPDRYIMLACENSGDR